MPVTKTTLLKDLDPETVTWEELCDSLKEHIRGRFSLNGNNDKVRNIVRELDTPTNEIRRAMITLAQEGESVQRTRENSAGAEEYALLERQIRRKR